MKFYIAAPANVTEYYTSYFLCTTVNGIVPHLAYIAGWQGCPGFGWHLLKAGWDCPSREKALNDYFTIVAKKSSSTISTEFSS